MTIIFTELLLSVSMERLTILAYTTEGIQQVAVVAMTIPGGIDDVSIKETSSSSSSLEGHAAKGFSPIYVSALSIVFVIIALLVPLDHATHVTMETAPESTTRGHHHHLGSSRPIPQRGKDVGENFDAKDLYDAYKEVETEYHIKAFHDAAKWKILASNDYVEVSMMEHASDPQCPYVRMVGVIPTSVQQCWDWLSLSNWPTNMPKMDPFYEGVELYGNFDYRGVNMILARKKTKRILGLAKRDMVVLSVSDRPLSDGTWVSGSVSIQTPQIPRQSGYIRAFQDSIAFYKPLDGNTKTVLTIICRIDLNDSSPDGEGGWIPMWLYVKTVGATGLRSVTIMRDIIMKEKPLSTTAEQGQNNLKVAASNFWRHLNGGGAGKNEGGRQDGALNSLENQIEKSENSGSTRTQWRLPWQKKVDVVSTDRRDSTSSNSDGPFPPGVFLRR